MLKISTAKWLSQMAAVILLAVLWLIIAGHYAKLPPIKGVIYAIIVLLAFTTLQIVIPYRLHWTIRTLMRLPTPRQVGLGLTAACVNFIAGILWLTAFKMGSDQGSSGLLPAQVYVGVFLFPVIEEVGFRGWMQQVGERRLNPVVAMLFATALFAAFHSSGDWLPRITDGLVLGSALLATRSLWLTMGMHALLNLLVVVASQWGWLNRHMEILARVHPAWLAPSAIIVTSGIAVSAIAVAIYAGAKARRDGCYQTEQSSVTAADTDV